MLIIPGTSGSITINIDGLGNKTYTLSSSQSVSLPARSESGTGAVTNGSSSGNIQKSQFSYSGTLAASSASITTINPQPFYIHFTTSIVVSGNGFSSGILYLENQD